MFFRNCWYVAGHALDATRQPMTRIFLDEPVVIYRTEAGQAVAMDNRCPHRFAPLHQGKLFGDTIQCPYHGLRFNTSGQCVKVPLGGGEPPPNARLKVYPLVERHSLLWIWMGDAAAADAATIPDFAYLESQEYDWFTGSLYAKANYQLLVDNLLDLSHSEFLHPQLSSPGWCGRAQQTIDQVGDTITVQNIAHDDDILPVFARFKPHLHPVGTTTMEERWDAPGLIRLAVTYESRGDSICAPSGHFLTPETQKTTHYFFRGGQGTAPGDAAITEAMRQAITHTFATEDIPMIEAEQIHLGDRDLLDAQPAMLRGDSGAIRARRWLTKKIRDENSAGAATHKAS